MRPSKECLDLIRHFEGYHHALPNGDCQAYPDPGSDNGEPYTIGWGTTRYRNAGIAKYGRTQVKSGDVLTREQAQMEFESEVAHVADAVRKMTSGKLLQSQFDAAVSFAYNAGLYNKNMERLKAGDLAGFEKHLPLYVKGGNGKPLEGLVRRRKAELELWRKDSMTQSPEVKHELLLERTGKKEDRGCELLKLSITGSEFAILVRSGQPWAQVFQNGGSDNRPGSMMPLPGGEWSVSDIEWAGGKDNYRASWGTGLGPLWVGIYPKFSTRRSAFGIHEDAGSYSTAGCIGVRSLSDLKELVAALRKWDPRVLHVAW